jgi:ADP-ribosylglycohydrolase
MSVEKAQALLFGLALGDALGWPTEFMELSDIKQRYGPHGIDEPPDPALYTDDTQMTVALAEGLLDAGPGAPLDTLMEAIGRRFLTWKDSPENNRAPGRTVMQALGRYENGMPWRESGLLESKGCGSAMRVAPIGYLYRQDEPRLYEVAGASSLLTHRHPAAVAASIAAAYLVGLALEDVPPGEYLRQVMLFCDGISEDFDAAILRVGHVLGWVDEEAALRHIGEGWVGEEAVGLALYCVLRYPDDYVACVRRAANTNGDSDSISCIAGGIMGARLGLDAIPVDWINQCENRDYLFDLSQRMAAAV